MSVSETNFDLEGKSLGLIDFCSEDDCLYVSPPRDHPCPRISDDQKEQKSVQFLEVQASRDSIESDEQVIQPFKSPDQKKTNKYNLRKSLAWDSAFFTSAGVLEPEELSTMISAVEQGHKRFALPGIEEEICRSSESECTLTTDNSTLGTLEDDLFGDIRASIQKSSKACQDIRKPEKIEEKLALTGIEEDICKSNDSISSLATYNATLGTREDDIFGDIRAPIQESSKASRALSQGKLASRVNASQLIKSSEKVRSVSQDKLMTKAAVKKSSIITKGSGKVMNKVSPRAEASKCGSRTGKSASSLIKPPKIIARAHTFSAVPTKRTSLSANCIKVEKDNAKALPVPDRGTKLPANGASRYVVPKPLAPVKSSLRTPVASKTQLTPSSSIDSFESLSSNSIKRSSVIEKHKIDSSTGNCSSISSTGRRGSAATRIAPSRTPSISSRILPHLKSLTKPSSSRSPASSVSEWSSESLSPTCTVNSRSNISRPSIDTSSWKTASNRANACQASGSENHSNDSCSAGNSTRVTGLLNKSANRVSTGNRALNHPEAIKPSGLRMPSPKIGFFDGAKSTVRTSTKSLKSPAAPCNLPRSGSVNVSPGKGLKEARREKLQPARTVMAIRCTKDGAQKITSESKPKSPLPLQESSNISPKVSSGLRTGKNHPSIPLKVSNKKSPGKDEQYSLNAENIASKESETANSNRDLCDSERSNGPSKDTLSSHDEGNNSAVGETPSQIGRSSSSMVEGEFFSQQNDSRPVSEIKSKSSLPLQQASNLSPQIFSVSRTGKQCPGRPLEVLSKMSAGKDEPCNLNPMDIAKESNAALSISDFCSSDRNNSLCKDKVSSYGEGNDSGKADDIPTADRGSSATCNSNSTTDQEGNICSQKDDLKPVSESKPKSPLALQEASNCSPEVCCSSRTGRHSQVMPLNVQNTKSSAKDDHRNSNIENIAAKESNTAISNSESCNSERSGSLCKDKSSSYGAGNKAEKVDIPTVQGSSAACNASCMIVDEGELCSHKNDSRPASEIKTISPSLIQEASNLSPKVFSGSETAKHSPGMPLETQSKKSPGKDEQCNLNAENIATKETNTVTRNSDICSSERSYSLCRDEMGSHGEGDDSGKLKTYQL